MELGLRLVLGYETRVEVSEGYGTRAMARARMAMARAMIWD